MFDQSSPWLSFGFKDNKPALLKYQNFSLDHQHTQQKNHKTMGQTLIAPNPRREKQRHRVNEAMHKRMLERRARIQRDLLQGFSPEYIDSIIGQEPTHNYYHHYVNNQGEDIGSISDLGSFSTQSEKTVQRKFLTTRTRPKSAPFVRRNPPIKEEMLDAAILPTNYADETNIIVGDRRRPASAQVTRKTRAGCEYCPVDCRPLSSSSHKPTSSTGLQATNGPAHFHYFHYNRYMRFQRPKSAIATRREYLESTNRHQPEESPRFTNIVKSCTVHKKEASLEQKPQSPRTKVKVAWVEDEPMILDNSNVVITPPEPTDKTINQSDGFVQAADQSTQVVADDEDSELNAGVRFQAEVTYQQATDDHIDTFEEELDFDARKDILGLPRAPTPTPVSSRAQSPEAKQEGEQELPKPPVIYQSTDILTGRSNSAYEVDMEVAGEDVDFVDIEMPEPLPVIRVVQPAVQRVDIVGPREELILSPDILEIVEPTTEEDESADEQIVNKVESIEVVNRVERPPVSILKSSDDKHDKAPVHVQFVVPTDDVKSLIDEVLEPSDDITAPVDDVIEPSDDIIDTQSTIEVLSQPEIVQLEIIEPEPTPEVIQENVKIEEPPLFKEQEKRSMPAVLTVVDTNIKQEKSEEKLLPPAPPLYEEPTDEDVCKLLAPPDISDFQIPTDLKYSSPAKKKGKKSLSSGRKKKKKKKKEKKEVVKEEPEPLFEYDPNAPDPIEEARLEIMNRKRENTELSSAIISMRLFDDQCKEKIKNQPWLFGRMALSRNICRFWLPIDVRDLQGLSPAQYLSKYCVITKRRYKLYAQAFERQLNKRKTKDTSIEAKTTLDIKGCDCALRDVHSNCIDDKQIALVRELVCINNNDTQCSVSRVKSSLFCQVCALTERLFYSHFVTEDGEDEMTSQKQKIEDADFDGLEWRLRNVTITDDLRRLLFSL